MRKFLDTIVAFIFPPSEEALMVSKISDGAIRDLYKPGILPSATALSVFGDARIRALIHEAKFRRNERAFFILGKLTHMYLEEHPNTYDIIVPVPLSARRLKERGHNQVMSALSAQESTIPIVNVIARVRHTPPQTELGRNERIHNIKDAFQVSRPELISGKRVLLVDDVTTTGATLMGAKDALLSHSPASVTCIAFAH